MHVSRQVNKNNKAALEIGTTRNLGMSCNLHILTIFMQDTCHLIAIFLISFAMKHPGLPNRDINTLMVELCIREH